MNGPRRSPARHPHHHAVQFYGDDSELVRTVAAFLVEGLVANQPAVVIATAAHTDAILDDLTSRHIDVQHARRLGDLIVLDAHETLAMFMNRGMPDPVLFQHTVGGILDQAARGRERTPVRAYGEMVDVLWKRGSTAAAVRLEVLWNELASTHTFSLFCGYAIGNFYKQAAKIDEVVRQHTHVVGHPPDGSPRTP